MPILYIGSITSGFGQAIIWIAQGEYVSLCANEETKGFFFALFWAFYMGSQIFGNLTGALIITKASGPSFFLIMGIIMLISVIGFYFLKHPHKFEVVESGSENIEEPQTFTEMIQSTLVLLWKPKMMMMNLQLMFTGISISYWSGIITPIVIF